MAPTTVIPLHPEPVCLIRGCPGVPRPSPDLSQLPLTSLDTPPPQPPPTPGRPAVTAPVPQLNFSEHLYFENGLQNLKAGAQRSLKKLRKKVDQNL